MTNAIRESMPTVETNAREHMQPFPVSVLLAAARGDLDLNALARQTLIDRGLDPVSGKWVGFTCAANYTALDGKTYTGALAEVKRIEDIHPSWLHPICGSCNERDATVTPREDSTPMCESCWAAALAYGHRHGMHVDDDGQPVRVEGCPSCPRGGQQ
jgi:hypothetical protein